MPPQNVDLESLSSDLQAWRRFLLENETISCSRLFLTDVDQCAWKSDVNKRPLSALDTMHDGFSKTIFLENLISTQICFTF